MNTWDMKVMISEKCNHFIFQMFNFKNFIEVGNARRTHYVLRSEMMVDFFLVFSCVDKVVDEIFERNSMRLVFICYKSV